MRLKVHHGLLLVALGLGLYCLMERLYLAK